MINKLFSQTFKITILALVTAETLSLLVAILPILKPVAFFGLLLAALIFTFIRFEYGVFFLLAELFVGGHGYLFSLNLGGSVLSIRMGLFVVVLAAWLVKALKNKSLYLPPRALLTTYLALCLIFLFGLANGLGHQGFANVFFDSNAWLYFILILVFFDLIKDEKIINQVIGVLIAATSWLSLKTIFTLFLFAHGFARIGDWFYKWLRDTGVGEITYVSDTIFRVFFQSQIYCLIGFFLVLFYLVVLGQNKERKKMIWPIIYLILTSLAILISQSRSFWVGGVAAMICLIVWLWWQKNFRFKKTFWLALFLGIMFISDLILFAFVSGRLGGNLITNRLTNLESEPAGISRLNQLEPLAAKISQQPFFGFGFGQELTYKSSDPRILKTHPDGLYTTYAFEWGYLDIALKLGIVGLLIYLALLTQIVFLGIKETKIKNLEKSETKILGSAFLFGLIALSITNIFSPYLNHPLGIGYVILISAIYANDTNQD